MSKTGKETETKPQPKAATPSKNQPTLTEKQLDDVSGGICATGKHFPAVKLTTG